MTKAALLLGTALLTAGTASADDRLLRIFQALDANGDGAVSRQEMHDRRADRFRALDVNGDQRLSVSEISASLTPERARRMKSRFYRMDTDGDGSIDRAEFSRRVDRQFRRLDENGDGLVTADELRAMRGRNRRGG